MSIDAVIFAVAHSTFGGYCISHLSKLPIYIEVVIIYPDHVLLLQKK